jgi:hypothetical protein
MYNVYAPNVGQICSNIYNYLQINFVLKKFWIRKIFSGLLEFEFKKYFSLYFDILKKIVKNLILW